MVNFELIKIEEIKSGKLTAVKLTRNNKCFYDDFCTDIENGKLKNFQSELNSIRSRIQMIVEDDIYAAVKFKWVRPIKSKGKVIAYEIKTKNLRLYFTLENPQLIVFIGGVKKKQTKDINKLESLINEFDKIKLT